METSDLVREIDDAIAGYEADIEDLALLSSTTRSDVARVAAVRARMNARTRKLEMLSVLGAVDQAQAELDVRSVTHAVIRAFDEHGVSDDARRAVLAALRAGHPGAEDRCFAA